MIALRRTLAKWLGSERGFTMTELLITTAIIGVVMSGLYVMLASGEQSYLVGTNQAEAQQALRLSVDRIMQDLRTAGYCPTCASACPTPFPAITAQSATGFTIQYDWNADYNCGTGVGINTTGTVNYLGTGTQRGENIIYALSGTNLTRREMGVDGAPVVIAGGITSLAFTYLDVNDAVTATPGNIRRIGIAITARPQNQPAATAEGKVLVSLQDSIRLRNRLK
jgi:prepilin-type N-terminal cleavage/methylation domain-containing protein